LTNCTLTGQTVDFLTEILRGELLPLWALRQSAVHEMFKNIVTSAHNKQIPSQQNS